MKLRDLKQVVGGLFPPIFLVAFERCHSLSEVKAVIFALQIAREEVRRIEDVYLGKESERLVELATMKAQLAQLEARLESFTAVATVREPQEEVLLVPPPAGPATEAVGPERFKYRIGLIKAVREVTGKGLAEAKDLVDDILDKNEKKTVFKGPLDKATVAVRVLSAAGGVTERKEAF
jgi:ribosomal protein L7/L12